MRVRIKVRFKNEHFRSARIEAGFATQTDLYRASGINKNTLSQWENFRNYPRSKAMERRLERAIGVLIDDMFPQAYKDAVDRKLGRPLERVMTLKELPEWAGPRMLPMPTEMLDAAEMREAVERALDTLTEREADVLKMRFGIPDGNEFTLEETGVHFRVSRNRIAQIEAKALRKLKHPNHGRSIREFLPEAPKVKQKQRTWGVWPGYAVDMWDHETPLCINSSCRKMLEQLDKAHIKTLQLRSPDKLVPPEVIKWPEDFLYCEDCRRIYRSRRDEAHTT